MLNYELVYILSPKFSEKEIGNLRKTIQGILEKNGAKILKEDFWGRKKLAYPIHHFKHGYYNLIEFSSSPDLITKIEKKLRLFEEIIRFLIVKQEKARILPESLEMEIEKPTPQVFKPIKEKKIKLKELDQKLKEILKES